ncbi:MAG: hypothetical protein OEU46_09215 [Alphaproteobacteria bacterium]|nr:hypothetical protein [Alphaproteobacteria bacterium]
MSRLLFAVVLAAALAGCSTPEVRLSDHKDTVNLRGQSVTIVNEDAPSFGALTADKAMFAVVGAVAAHEKGRQIIAENKVEDPSRRIERKLAHYLRRHYHTKANPKVLDFAQKDKPDDLGAWAKSNNTGGIIVDVETRGWGFNYFPTTWSRYRVGYSGLVRITDTKTGKIFVQYMCHVGGPEKAEVAPTYDEMMGNQAAHLKKLLKERADKCIDQIKSKVL